VAGAWVGRPADIVGRLYVVPTPIGNLEDITLRALSVLRTVPVILAEDTRHTRKLLTHFEIGARLISYHQHNKRARLDAALGLLESGDVALVSSAGMPAIADPGFELIEAAIRGAIPVEVLPGASAVVTAVVAASLPAPGFLFAGFLPRRTSEQRHRLAQLASLPYSLVVYEAPHRLRTTLANIGEVLGDRKMVAAREMTKVHETILRGTVGEVAAHFEIVAPRGEFTLVIAGAPPLQEDRTDEALDALRARRRAGEGRKTAIEDVVSEFGIARNEAYRLWLSLEPEGQ